VLQLPFEAIEGFLELRNGAKLLKKYFKINKNYTDKDEWNQAAAIATTTAHSSSLTKTCSDSEDV
jgi:hypothetical protein